MQVGGTMWFETEEGVGSSFYFTIVTNTVPTDFALKTFDNLNVLLYAHCKQLLSSVSQHLEKLKVNYVVCETSQCVINKIHNGQWDLVLVEYCKVGCHGDSCI